MTKRLFLLFILAFQNLTGEELAEPKKEEPIDWFKEASYSIAKIYAQAGMCLRSFKTIEEFREEHQPSK